VKKVVKKVIVKKKTELTEEAWTPEQIEAVYTRHFIK
jgi:hypothetical protein